MKLKYAKATRIDVQKDGTTKVVYQDRDVLTRPGPKGTSKAPRKRKSA